MLSFEVTDDGVGFDPATARMGTGLTNMRDRVDALGGRLEVTAHPGAGTCIRAALPVPVPTAALA
jgi:signal transduction histidine kinase